MSYITITVADQKVGLKFGMPAIKRIYKNMASYDMWDIGIYSEEGLAEVLYAGYYNHQFIKHEPVVVPFEEFYNYVQGAGDNEEVKAELLAAVKAFEESTEVKKVLAKVDDNEKKSPLTGMNSNQNVTENSDSGPEIITSSPGENIT